MATLSGSQKSRAGQHSPHGGPQRQSAQHAPPVCERRRQHNDLVGMDTTPKQDAQSDIAQQYRDFYQILTWQYYRHDAIQQNGMKQVV